MDIPLDFSRSGESHQLGRQRLPFDPGAQDGGAKLRGIERPVVLLRCRPAATLPDQHSPVTWQAAQQQAVGGLDIDGFVRSGDQVEDALRGGLHAEAAVVPVAAVFGQFGQQAMIIPQVRDDFIPGPIARLAADRTSVWSARRTKNRVLRFPGESERWSTGAAPDPTALLAVCMAAAE